MAKIGAKMIVQACEKGTENYDWGFREGESVIVIDPAREPAHETPGMIVVESESRRLVGYFAPEDLRYMGVTGDSVPRAATTVDDKIAYAYVASFGNVKKCYGYATPKAVEILKENGYEVSVETFEPGAPIPDQLP